MGRTNIIQYRLQWDDYLYDDPAYSGVQDTVPWVTLSTFAQDTTKASFSYTHIINPSFLANKKVNYRVQAENGVGSGVWSVPLQLTTDNVPDQMTTPSVTSANILPKSIEVTWTA